MQITVTETESKVPVTILHLKGEVDASNYQLVIGQARQAYAAGARHLLLDLSEVPYIGSSALVAFHSVALLVQGKTPPDPEAGWGALRSIDRERKAGLQQNVRLLNPQPKVERVLRMAGLERLFEIHTDQAAAIASFG